MEKTCRQCLQIFEVTSEDLAFYQKIAVPPPTCCPSCRHLRRHGHINDYVFYSRICDNCKKPFVSVFPPKSEYKVFCNHCWWSEKRDPFEYFLDYDPAKSFFEQFDELMHNVPQLGIIGMNNENCDYCESTANCKNCYLISESSNCEDCFYGYWLQKSKDCFDCSYIHECEQSYELMYCFNCYNLKYSQNCFSCSDSYFLDNCIECKNCLFSTNLRHKEYYIFNKPVSKEVYDRELNKLGSANFSDLIALRQKFQDFLKIQPRRHLQIENAENCSGDYIRNAKNCKQVYHSYDAEECAYGEHVWRGAKYCFDSNTAGRNAELLYETTNSGIDSYNVKFSRYCWGCHNTEYSNECKNGAFLFGCVGLKPGAKYCIFNRQYTPDEYQKIVSKIKETMIRNGEYGEFFPLSIALFGYNNSVSFDEAPYSKEEALKRGWKWEDQTTGTKGKGTIEINKICFSQESLLREILTCQNCQKNYRLIAAEISFCKKHGLPVPTFCPDCRHRSRLERRNKKTLGQTICAQCKKQIHTTLDPSKYRLIYCESCYLRQVY